MIILDIFFFCEGFLSINIMSSSSSSWGSMGDLRLTPPSSLRSISPPRLLKDLRSSDSDSDSTISIPMRIDLTGPNKRPKRNGPRNTYHCCNKGKKDLRGASICPSICPGYDIGPDGNLYCSWCLPKKWEKKACTLQDWIKIKENRVPAKLPPKKKMPRKPSSKPKEVKLVVKPSGISGAGQGLFTLEKIKKNQKIVEYTGVVKTIEEFEAKPSWYGFTIPGDRIIDAHSTDSGIGRYANDCRKHNKEAGECSGINSRFVVNTSGGKTTVWITATKNIASNEEIFIPYGAGYWRDSSRVKEKKKTKIKATVVLKKIKSDTSDTETVQYLKKHDFDPNGLDAVGHSPFTMAAFVGKLKTLKYLKNQGANINHIQKKTKDTALSSAIYSAVHDTYDFKVVKYLLSIGLLLEGARSARPEETEMYDEWKKHNGTS